MTYNGQHDDLKRAIVSPDPEAILFSRAASTQRGRSEAVRNCCAAVAVPVTF